MSGEYVRERHVATDFSRGEATAGLAWLAVGALISVLLEVLYLDFRIGNIMLPLTALCAFGFNAVLSKTARLWSANIFIALIPMYAWLCGYFGLLMWEIVDGSVFIPGNISAILLLFGGILGSSWPFMRRR
ncbi:MAG: hypothetical protein Q3976_00930 [Corynebacterium sp.]|nr:hypothetical protein [Corynebacterium sp.]